MGASQRIILESCRRTCAGTCSGISCSVSRDGSKVTDQLVPTPVIELHRVLLVHGRRQPTVEGDTLISFRAHGMALQTMEATHAGIVTQSQDERC